MSEIKSKIQAILLNNSQKSVIGWSVEEEDFEKVSNEILELVKKSSDIQNVSKRYWLMSYRTEGVFRTDTIEAPNELTAKTVFHHNRKGMKLIKCTETYDC